MKKELKNILFYFILFMIIGFLCLFVRQTIKVYNYYNTKITIENDEIYDEGITKARNKLANLRNNLASGYASYSGECLDEIEKVIDYSVAYNYPEGETRKDIINYQNSLLSSTDASNWLNIINIKSACNITDAENIESLNYSDYLLVDNALKNEKQINSSLKYIMNLKFDNYVSEIEESYLNIGLDTVKDKTRISNDKKIMDTEVEYINNILDYVGGNYE